MQPLQQKTGSKESAVLLEMWASLQLLAVAQAVGDGLSQGTGTLSESATVWVVKIVVGMCCFNDLCDPV